MVKFVPDPASLLIQPYFGWRVGFVHVILALLACGLALYGV